MLQETSATKKSKEEFGKQRGDLWDLPIHKSKGKTAKSRSSCWDRDKNITHLTTTKRASAAKSLKFTDSLTSSTTAEYVATTCTSHSRPAVFFGNPLAWTSPQYSGAELVRQAFSAPLSTWTPVSTQPVGKLRRYRFFPSQIRRLLSSGMHLTEKSWTLSTQC